MVHEPTALAKMQSAIQLAAFHYIVCLKATPSNSDCMLKIGSLEFHFDNIRTADSRVLHVEFQRWAASAVLRDLIEHFSIFLMETYRDIVTNSPERTFLTSPERFEQRGIEDQLTILSKEFSIDPKWIERLTGYNRARNCFAHRAGVVGVKDVTDGEDLIVRWLNTQTALTDTSPTQMIDVGGPMGNLVCGQHIHGSFAATVELLDREKRISIGNLIHFLPDEILEICQTFQLASAAFAGIKT